MIKVEGQAQNLRNKYKNHSLIVPIIQYCEKNKLGFEFLKASTCKRKGLKSFKTSNFYYMKIGKNLLKSKSQLCAWSNIIDLISSAYEYLQLKQPESLAKAVTTFKK